MAAEIFKLQRAQFTWHPAGNNLILAYNKDRSIQGEFPMPDDQIKIVFEGRQKVYVKGTHRPDGKIEISDHAEEQDW